MQTVPSGYDTWSTTPSDFCLLFMWPSLQHTRQTRDFCIYSFLSAPPKCILLSSFLHLSFNSSFLSVYFYASTVLSMPPDNHYKSLLNPHLLDRWEASAHIWHYESVHAGVFVCVREREKSSKSINEHVGEIQIDNLAKTKGWQKIKHLFPSYCSLLLRWLPCFSYCLCVRVCVHVCACMCWHEPFILIHRANSKFQVQEPLVIAAVLLCP